MDKRKLKKAVRRFSNFKNIKHIVRYAGNRRQAYRLKRRDSQYIAYPSNIQLELTNYCNLECQICPRESELGKDMDIGFMKFDLFTKIVDEALPYLDSIGLTGTGETLLYKHIVEAVDYIREADNGVILFLSTNAHVPKTLDLVEKIADKVDTIQVSVDGVYETYNEIRKNTNFEIFSENLAGICEITKGKRADVLLNMVVIPENYKEMKDVINLAKSNEIKYVNFNAVNWVCSPENIQDYELFESDEFFEELNKVKGLANEAGIIMTHFDFETPANFQKCGFPWNHFFITWDGYVALCCAKPFPKEVHFGNVNDHKLIECLNHPRFRGIRKLWSENKTPTFCDACHMIEIPKPDYDSDDEGDEE